MSSMKEASSLRSINHDVAGATGAWDPAQVRVSFVFSI